MCYLPTVFFLVMEMILRTTEANTNEITGPSIKAFMNYVTLHAEFSLLMEQLGTGPQEFFKWVTMKRKSSKCCYLSIVKGNCREIKSFVNETKSPQSTKKVFRPLVTATPYHLLSISLAGPKQIAERWIMLH